jgi:hypothetical protein
VSAAVKVSFVPVAGSLHFLTRVSATLRTDVATPFQAPTLKVSAGARFSSLRTPELMLPLHDLGSRR